MHTGNFWKVKKKGKVNCRGFEVRNVVNDIDDPVVSPSAQFSVNRSNPQGETRRKDPNCNVRD